MATWDGNCTGWARPFGAAPDQQENQTAKCIRLLATIGVIGCLAASASEQQSQDYVAVDQTISSEPTYSGKYQ